MTFVSFLRFMSHIRFCYKNSKKYVPCDKNLNLSILKLTIVTFLKCYKMSRNVTKYHTLLNPWYRIMFTFYVWISLGTPLRYF